jgi:hypothetical protein
MSDCTVGNCARRTGALLVIASGLIAVMVGCGGSASSFGGVSGASHSSPEGAVRGFVNALTGWDGTASGLNAVAQWVAPAQRTDFTSEFTALTTAGESVKISFKVDNFDVSSVDSTTSDHATVHVRGTGSYCFSGSIAGVSASTCSTASLTPSGSKDTINTVNVSGQWYVDISGGGNQSTTSSTSVTLPPSTSDTGTGSATVGTDTGTGSASTTASNPASST